MPRVYAVMDDKGNYFMSGAYKCDEKIPVDFYRELIGKDEIKFVTYSKIKKEEEALRVMNLVHKYFINECILSTGSKEFYEMMDYVNIVKDKYDNKQFDN